MAGHNAVAVNDHADALQLAMLGVNPLALLLLRLHERLSEGDGIAQTGANSAAALEGRELALVLDSIGGPAVAELAHRLRFGGKVVSFGALGGQPTALSVRQDLIYRQISHHGFWTLGGRVRVPDHFDPHLDRPQQRVSQHLGRLTLELGATLPLGRLTSHVALARSTRRVSTAQELPERADALLPSTHVGDCGWRDE